jgi:hypothetical protein
MVILIAHKPCQVFLPVTIILPVELGIEHLNAIRFIDFTAISLTTVRWANFKR